MGGALRRLFGKKEVRVLILGLDAAGKTTALYQMKLGEVVTTIPTIGFNVETLEYNNVRITAWDVGGREKSRPLQRHYYPNTHAVIFIVDSGDGERLPEVKEEIERILWEDDLWYVQVLIVANKQDLPSALSVDDLTEKLELTKIRQNWCIVPAIATTGEGLNEGLEWLTNQLAHGYAKQAVNSRVKEVENSVKTNQALVSAWGYISKSWSCIRDWLAPH